MRFSLVNPNCNARLTGELASAMRRRLWPGDCLEAETADSATSYIGSPETIAQARVWLEKALQERASGADAIVVACFGDLGLAALQRSIGVPLVTLWDGYILAARQVSARIGIITTSSFWVDRMVADAARAGLAHRTVIAAIDVPPHAPPYELANATVRAADVLALQGAEALVLGGALFAGLDRTLAGHRMPVIDLNAVVVDFCRTGRRFVTP